MALGDNDHGKGSVESGVAGMGKDFLTFRGKGHCWGKVGEREGMRQELILEGGGEVWPQVSPLVQGEVFGGLWGKELLFLVTDDVLQVT